MKIRRPVQVASRLRLAARDAATEEERRRRVEELVLAARSAARVTEELLSLDRLQQGDGTESFEDFDLGALVEQTCADLAPTILASDIEFELAPSEASLPVHADRFFVSEALKNLIDNARKHGGKGLTQIIVRTEIEDGLATITVKDDGRGLLPEDADTAFRRFSQVEPSDGSGLGLAIAASVAERHSGLLRINPSEQGASLTIGLPLAGS